jgi:hypothetical protein
MKWEGQQQDASQETCLLRRVSNFREKRFGYGKFYTFLPILLRLLVPLNEKKGVSLDCVRVVILYEYLCPRN